MEAGFFEGRLPEDEEEAVSRLDMARVFLFD